VAVVRLDGMIAFIMSRECGLRFLVRFFSFSLYSLVGSVRSGL